MNTQAGAVTLLGVARVQPRSVLATFTPRISSKQQKEFSQGFEAALDVVRPVGSARFKGENNGFSFLFQVDPAAQLVYGAVIRDPDYPERIAYQLLSEFQKTLVSSFGQEKLQMMSRDSLERRFGKEAKGLINKYGKLSGADPTSQVLQKVESVKVVVDANIKKVLENHGNLQDLASKSDSLAGASRQFKKEATGVKHETWKQKAGLTIVIGVLLAAILGYMIFVIIQLAT
ncbi:hypothetical protein Emag_005280 [Eimeria magna]